MVNNLQSQMDPECSNGWMGKWTIQVMISFLRRNNTNGFDYCSVEASIP